MQYVNYEEDLRDYTDLLKIDSINPQYNLGMAITLYSNYQQPKSIPFFERAFRHTVDTIGDAYFFLASAYHLAGNYDQAERVYKVYYSMLMRRGSELTNKEDQFLKEDIKRRIEMCGNGRQMMQYSKERAMLIRDGRRMMISDIGNNVNSRFDDYDGVFTLDDSTIYFTTRREGTTGARVDYDDRYYEDICVSYKDSSGWTVCEPLPRPINTRKHEAILSVTPEGKRIYFYKGVKQGTFFYSDKTGKGAWIKPRILLQKTDINSNAWETSFFGFAVTVAGDEMFIVSDRDGGLGGRDIYVSKKLANGSWGDLTNLGPSINTKYDEDAPFLSADGNTMYFSSSGHTSMGGFDIFRSMRVDGKWGAPENLGPPLNTPGDDIYLTFLHQEDRASYSSSGFAPDSSRDMDIYMIEFCDDPEKGTIKGLVRGASTGTLSVAYKDSAKEVASAVIQNGRFEIIVPLGKELMFTCSLPDTTYAPVLIPVPQLCKSHDLYQEIVFKTKSDSLEFKNAFFDIAKATLNKGDTSYGDFLARADKEDLKGYFVAKAAPAVRKYQDTIKAIILVTTDSIKHTTQTSITFNNVLFDFNKYNIKDQYKPDLDKIAEYLVKAQPGDKIEVAGHTDSKGPLWYNQQLSEKRANVVAVYFVSGGVVRKRMKVIGYGEIKPVAPNENQDGSDNPEGRALNRRTEIIILSTDVTAVIDDYFEGKGVYVLKEINELIAPILAAEKQPDIVIEKPQGIPARR